MPKPVSRVFCRVRRRRQIGLRSALLLAFAGAAASAAPLPDNFMPADRIQPGMRGEGVSVFQGYEPTPFQAEILGVEHNWFAGGDLILARLSGGPLEDHGVAAGMSGSPVYIDGKLIGAVAYGWTYSQKPYAGITPIAQMWEVFESIGKLPRPPDRRAGVAPANRPWDWQPEWESYKAAFEDDAEPVARRGFRPTLPQLAAEQGEFIPLATPLLLSGASPRTEQRLRRFFAARGYELLGAGTMAGSAAARQDQPAPPLVPGSSLGVPFLSGDMSLAGIGTVTWRQDDRIIAFGHPLNHDGSVNFPMAPAFIFGIMQSYARTFKLGEVGDSIGAIDQDRVYAVGGRIGPSPSRVPIRLRIDGNAAFLAREYNFSAWEDPDLLPALAAAAIEEAYVNSVSIAGRLTVDVEYAIVLGDGRRFAKSQRVSSDFMPVSTPVSALMRDVYLLVRNPFAEADIAAIDASVRVQPGLQEDVLASLRPERGAYKAGETVNLTAVIQPWRGDEYRRRLSIGLPDGLPAGVYVIHAVDTDGADRMHRAMHPGLYRPRDFDELLSIVGHADQPSNQIRVALFEPAIDLEVRGDVLRRLPASFDGVLQATIEPRDMNPSVGRLLAERTFPAAAPVFGSQSVVIQVVDHFDE
jgi:hypothetical protein